MKRHQLAFDLLGDNHTIYGQVKTLLSKQELTQEDFDRILENLAAMWIATQIAQEDLYKS